ncbi:MAG: fibronectin type III domain-containing protein [Bacteroidetes bacterium]|nr:fibronectin type III domain-containing protein [Bacteroidota bacterium]
MKNILNICFCILITNCFAQKKPESLNLSANYDGGDIMIEYKIPVFKNLDSVNLVLHKTSKTGEKVMVKRKLAVGSIWKYLDTTTRRNPGIYQYRIETSYNTTVLQNDEVWAYAFAPDLVPVAATVNVENIKGSNKITINWQIENNFTLRTIQLQRSRTQTENFITIATLNSDQTNFLDEVSDANEPYFYRLQMVNVGNNKIYYSVVSNLVANYPIIPLQIAELKYSLVKDKITLSWQNMDANTKGFYIMKRTIQQDSFSLASTKIAATELKGYQWQDTSSTLTDQTTYQYYVLSESNSFDKSKPSDTLTVSYSKKIKSLSPPQNLQLIQTPDSIYNLAWQIDSLRNHEIAAYSVYIKASNSDKFLPLKNGIVLADQNYVQIPKPNNGDEYYVKAVNPEMESVPSLSYTYSNAFQQSFGPKYLKAAVINNHVHIKWLIQDNMDIKAYKLYKWDGKKFLNIATIEKNKDTVETESYTANELNLYQLKAVNNNGVESSGSNVLQVN